MHFLTIFKILKMMNNKNLFNSILNLILKRNLICNININITNMLL